MIPLAVFLSLAGTVVTIVGGVGVAAMLLYGIYVLLAKSVVVGLMCIGASVVATFVVNVVHGALFAASDAAGRRPVRRLESDAAHCSPKPALWSDDTRLLAAVMEPAIIEIAGYAAKARLAGMPMSRTIDALCPAGSMPPKALNLLRETVKQGYLPPR
jgi:hypothetical protein